MPMNQVDVTKSKLLDELDTLRERLTLASRHARGPSPDSTGRKGWYRSVLDSLNAFVYVCSPDGVVEYVNERLEDRVGEDAVGRRCQDVIHGLPKACLWCGPRSGELADAEPTVGEHLSPRDGRWYQEAGAPMRHPDGSVSWVTLLVDITDRKLMEESGAVQHGLAMALNRATDLDEALELCMSAGTRVSGLECGGVYLINETTGALELACHTGLSPQFIEAMQVVKPDHPSAILVARGTPVYRPIEDLDGGVAAHMHHEGLRGFACVPLRHDDRVVGCISLASRRREDVLPASRHALETVAGQVGSTLARIRAEESLRRHVRLERLIASLSTRFISVSSQRLNTELRRALRIIGEFADVDRAHISLLSEDERSFLYGHEWCAEGVRSYAEVSEGLPTADFEWAAGQLREREVLHIPRVSDLGLEAARERALFEGQDVVSTVIVPLVSGERLMGVFGFEMVREERMWPEDTIALLKILGHVFGNAIRRRREETQRRRLEERFQQAQKQESLGVLAGGIAHDFNNLLMGILGNAGLALLDLTPEAPARESVSQIETAALRAADLTKQLLAYSGRGQIDVQSVDLSHVVEDMSHLLGTAVSKKAILRYDLDEGIPLVEGDATQVRQVVVNLTTNASDAIGNRSGVITVRTGATHADEEYLSQMYLNEDLPEGQYVFVEVSDTGCGMDAETEARIFDPFFTTKFVGRGLGLAAVLGIVRGHRGALHVHSRPGQGTVIRVLFPARDVAPAEETDPTP
ncbi:MAG: GAF domain-containing protein [bacterium]|nr:GAF domain-containing protein [bacterium]